MASGSGGVATYRRTTRTATGFRTISRAAARGRAYAQGRRTGVNQYFY